MEDAYLRRRYEAMASMQQLVAAVTSDGPTICSAPERVMALAMHCIHVVGTLRSFETSTPVADLYGSFLVTLDDVYTTYAAVRNRRVARTTAAAKHLSVAPAGARPAASHQLHPQTSGDTSSAGVVSHPPSACCDEASGHIGALRASLASAAHSCSSLSLRFSDIVGASEAVRELQQTVVLPARFPDLFPKSGPCRPWRSLLLYGPPGTGKTMLATAAACEAGATLFSVSAADLLSKFVGESEKLVRELFAMATATTPSVVFLDEIDSLCGARGATGESEAARRVKTELLIRMQAALRDPDCSTIVIAATNLPWELDPAFRRRFDQLIFVGLPDLAARREMVRVACSHVLGDRGKEEGAAGDGRHGSRQQAAASPALQCEMSDAEWDAVARALDGYSGSDISNIVRHAAMNPIRKMQSATHFVAVPSGPEQLAGDGTATDGERGALFCEPCDPNDPGAFPATLVSLRSPWRVRRGPIKLCDFEAAMEMYPRSVSGELLGQYDGWRLSLRSALPAGGLSGAPPSLVSK